MIQNPKAAQPQEAPGEQQELQNDPLTGPGVQLHYLTTAERGSKCYPSKRQQVLSIKAAASAIHQRQQHD